MKKSNSHIVLRNTLYNFIRQFWILCLGIITTPYIIKKLGTDIYGILSIVSVVIGYFGILGFGLSDALIKYISEYSAKKNYELVGMAIGSGLFIYSLMGFLGSVLIFSFTRLLVTKVLHIPGHLMSLSYFVFYICALIFLIDMPAVVFGVIPAALQRFDIVNKMSILIGTTRTIATIFLLYIGLFLKEIVIINLCMSLIAILAYLAIARRLLPGLKFRFIFNANMFIKLSRFGVFNLLTQIACQVVFQIDKLLIGIFLSLSSITYYMIPYNLSISLMAVTSNLQNAIFPLVSGLTDTDNHSFFKKLYIQSIKFNSLIAIPIATCLFIFAKPILLFWMGKDFVSNSTAVLKILSVSYLIATFSGIPSAILYGIGRPDITTIFAWISAVISLSCALLLIPHYGIKGPALALFINVLLTVPLFIWYISRNIIHMYVLDLFKKSILKPLCAGFILSIIFYHFNTCIKNLFTLLFVICLALLSYFMICYLMGVWDVQEKQAIRLHFFSLLRDFNSQLKLSKRENTH